MTKGGFPVCDASCKKYLFRMYAYMLTYVSWAFLLRSPVFLLLFGNRPWASHPPLYLAALSADGLNIEHPPGSLDPLAPAVGP